MEGMEKRRFRTWVHDTSVPTDKRWRIIFRHGYLTTIKAWYVWLPMLLVFIAVALGTYAAVFEWTSPYYGNSGRAPHYHGFVAMLVGTMYAVGVFILFVGTGLFAEDLRFNAPLFYFSKPLRVVDYFMGKAAVLGAYLGAVTLVPLLIWLLLLLVVGLPAVEQPTEFYMAPQGSPQFQEQLENWKRAHVDTFGDWLYLFMALVPGTTLSVAFLGSVTMLVSVLTRRAWHAAMGVVAVIGGLSMLGAVASSLHRDAFENIYGPIGWIYLVIGMPMRLRFDRWSDTDVATQNAGPAMALAYIFLLVTTALCGYLTLARLRRQEAWL